MKNYLFILFIFIVSCVNIEKTTINPLNIIERFEKKDTTITKKDIDKELAILQSNGKDSLIEVIYDKAFLFFFDVNTNNCLYYLKKKSELLKSKNNLSGYAICLQNMAFVYDEKLLNYELAKEYSVKAKHIWLNNNDSLNTANMLKYIGFLFGKLKEFDEAKLHIKESMNYYKKLSFTKGVAVCYFDLASVYQEELIVDSALYFFEKSKKIWSKPLTINRVFKINNKIMQLTINNNTREFNKCFNENIKFAKSNNIIKQDIDIFNDIVKKTTANKQ